MHEETQNEDEANLPRAVFAACKPMSGVPDDAPSAGRVCPDSARPPSPRVSPSRDWPCPRRPADGRAEEAGQATQEATHRLVPSRVGEVKPGRGTVGDWPIDRLNKDVVDW